jgi:uncharacterized protein YjlB
MQEPEAHRFTASGGIPNNLLPLLLYRQALTLAANDPATVLESTFAAHGWGGSWRNGIYDFHHFHSTAHEVLGIARGRVRVCLGGEAGQRFDLVAGDVVVIPAGVGHRNEGASGDLLVVGAYPEGQDWDLRRDDPTAPKQVARNIEAVPLPTTDPLHGPEGPLPRLWR